MTIIDGLLIFFSILFIYILVVYILYKIGFLKKYNISLAGPALLLRTKKGLKFLKRITGKGRLWKSYGSFAIVFCFIVMIIMIVFFLWQTWFLFGLDLTPEQKANLPGPEAALILPGINPILPIEYIGYIIIAFIIAIIVHEFSHGILALAGKLKVKSLGLLYFIVPIGAFTEPDDEELKKTETAKRMRVYAAGPLSNFVVAFVVLLLFSFVFMSAVQPADGVSILYTLEESPAEEAGLRAGVVIFNINGTEIFNREDFSNALDKTEPGQEVNISYFISGKTYQTTATLASLYEFIDSENQSYKNISFLGIGFNPYLPYLSALKNPFSSEVQDGFIFLYSIPILGLIIDYNPIVAPFTDSYIITGPLGTLPTGVFWVIVNALYWIFWLNLAVGLFNVLPMVPLDGGFLFNDVISSSIKRFKKDLSEEKRNKIVKNISLLVSIIILFMVIFPFIFKYI